MLIWTLEGQHQGHRHSEVATTVVEVERCQNREELKQVTLRSLEVTLEGNFERS